MTLPPPKILVPVLFAIVALIGGWLWWQRRPALQIPRLFERLEAAFHDKDASEILACIHPDYDLAGTWPQVLHDPGTARGDAKRIFAQVFLMNREEPISATITLISWKPVAGDARGGAEARINLAIQGGMFTSAVPLLSNHRFTVRPASWLTGAWGITGHDPIPVNLPGQ